MWKNCRHSLESGKTPFLGDLKITSSASTQRQERSQNLAPVLAKNSGNSLVFSRKLITSSGFYRCCAPGVSAPVVVKNQSPILGGSAPHAKNHKIAQPPLQAKHGLGLQR